MNANGWTGACSICDRKIEAEDGYTEHPTYGLAHTKCVDMADNGPSDSQLTDYAEPSESRHEREWDEKRRLG